MNRIKFLLILLAGIACVSIPFIVHAQLPQISPNPNPGGNTIYVNTPSENDRIYFFDNYGEIDISSTGSLVNYGWLYSYSGGTVN